MSTPEIRTPEGAGGIPPHQFRPEREQGEGEFIITFPDNTIGRFKSQMEAAAALDEWRREQ